MSALRFQHPPNSAQPSPSVQKKVGMQRKLQQYRRLHVDLKEIKNAVNRYVADRNASHPLTTPDGSAGA